MSIVYIGLGSNLGDRQANIEAALARLDALAGTRLVAVSAVIETDPVGVTDQPRFLNAAAQLETDLAPHDLLAELQTIEAELGRVRARRWGPRPIDLDILLYDSVVMRTEQLIIPHPHMADRRFVLGPLVELAPEVRHPLLGRSASQLLAELDRQEDDQPPARTGGGPGP